MPVRRSAGITSKLKRENASFLKKRSKKLLLLRALARQVSQPTGNESFFVSFFSKKEALTFSNPEPQP
jgi:hypothetical protein